MRSSGRLQPREIQILDQHGKGACVRFVASSRKATEAEAERLIVTYQESLEPASPGAQ